MKLLEFEELLRLQESPQLSLWKMASTLLPLIIFKLSPNKATHAYLRETCVLERRSDNLFTRKSLSSTCMNRKEDFCFVENRIAFSLGLEDAAFSISITSRSGIIKFSSIGTC
jgi:hypothetical protein